MRYVAFDFEWTILSLSPSSDNKEKQFREGANISTNKITAGAFVDSNGISKVLHISDYSNSEHPEYELLVDINKELLKYDFSIGWYSTGVAIYHEDTQEYLDGIDSDLVVLHNRCLANCIYSIVDFNNKGIPYVRGQKHIDLCNVFLWQINGTDYNFQK
jgi:DNA polymerase, archaea type